MIPSLNYKIPFYITFDDKLMDIPENKIEHTFNKLNNYHLNRLKFTLEKS